MTQEQQAPKPPRIRIKWSQLANGQWRAEMTHESEGISGYPQDKLDADMRIALEDSDKLRAELESRA